MVAAGSRFGEPEDLGWVALAVALYVVTLLVTAIVNVPLNNLLDSTEPVEDARALFEKRWVRWNAVRTVLCTPRSWRWCRPPPSCNAVSMTRHAAQGACSASITPRYSAAARPRRSAQLSSSSTASSRVRCLAAGER